MSGTYLVAESSTRLIHRAHLLSGKYPTADCSSGVTYGTRTVYLESARNVEVGTRPAGKLCKRCFPSQ